MRTLPYVVSGDIHLLLSEWVAHGHHSLPEEGFFSGLRDEFASRMGDMFYHYEFVPEDELKDGLNKFVSESDVPVISMDRVYVSTDLHIDVSRLTTKSGEAIGITNRSGYPSLTEQISLIVSSGSKEVALLDDVLFTGEVVQDVIKKLSSEGITVVRVYLGVGIGKDAKNIPSVDEVLCVRHYDDVIDEICERDFYPGVPFSGRHMIDHGAGVGAPYLKPFGNPRKWASIPEEHVDEFSRFCLKQTARLFQEIGRVSGRDVLCRDLPRRVITVDPDERVFADVLMEKLSEM